MFGYVRPLRDELKVRDFDRFKSAYCGLCRAISARYGFFPRLFLNYDFAFLAVVLSVGETEHGLHCAPCPASPFRKKCSCVRSPAFDLAADESVILTYRKLRDAAEDEGFIRGLPARVLSLLLLPSYRKAKRLRPDFDRRTTICLSELHDWRRNAQSRWTRPRIPSRGFYPLRRKNCTIPNNPARWSSCSTISGGGFISRTPSTTAKRTRRSVSTIRCSPDLLPGLISAKRLETITHNDDALPEPCRFRLRASSGRHLVGDHRQHSLPRAPHGVPPGPRGQMGAFQKNETESDIGE